MRHIKGHVATSDFAEKRTPITLRRIVLFYFRRNIFFFAGDRTSEVGVGLDPRVRCTGPMPVTLSARNERTGGHDSEYAAEAVVEQAGGLVAAADAG